MQGTRRSTSTSRVRRVSRLSRSARLIWWASGIMPVRRSCARVFESTLSVLTFEDRSHEIYLEDGPEILCMRKFEFSPFRSQEVGHPAGAGRGLHGGLMAALGL